MAVLDAEATIAVQLEALARQQVDEPWELIVADNGCTDRTLEIVETFRDRIERLRVVEARGRRCAAHALNIGVQEAHGDRLLFCDADDEVAPGWVGAMAAALSRGDFVTSKLTVDELNEPWVLEARGPSLMLEGLMLLPFSPHITIGPTAGMGVRRAVHEAVGGFDESVTTTAHRLLHPGAADRSEARVHPGSCRPLPVPRGPDATFKQANRYAHDFALLQKRYAEERPGFLRWLLKHWRPVLVALPRLYRKGVRGRLAWLLGYQFGRYRGSLEHRVRAI